MSSAVEDEEDAEAKAGVGDSTETMDTAAAAAEDDDDDDDDDVDDKTEEEDEEEEKDAAVLNVEASATRG